MWEGERQAREQRGEIHSLNTVYLEVNTLYLEASTTYSEATRTRHVLIEIIDGLLHLY